MLSPSHIDTEDETPVLSFDKIAVGAAETEILIVLLKRVQVTVFKVFFTNLL